MSTGSRSGSFSILVTRYYGQEVARRREKRTWDKDHTNTVCASQDELVPPTEHLAIQTVTLGPPSQAELLRGSFSPSITFLHRCSHPSVQGTNIGQFSVAYSQDQGLLFGLSRRMVSTAGSNALGVNFLKFGVFSLARCQTRIPTGCPLRLITYGADGSSGVVHRDPYGVGL